MVLQRPSAPTIRTRRYTSGIGPYRLTPRCARLMALALALTAPGCNQGGGTVDRLVDLVGSRRVIVPRLSGEFQHAPCDLAASQTALVTGLICRDRLDPFDPQVATLTAELARRMAVESSAEVRHAEAIWNLLWLDDQRFERVTGALQAVAAARPSNGEAWSDLAAAYLVRAELTQRPFDLVQALQASERALALDGSLPFALFNRALSLEALHLRSAAAAAWSEFVAVDGSSPWADEARARRARLIAPLRRGVASDGAALGRAASGAVAGVVEDLVRDAPQAAQQTALEQLLPAWSRNAAAGHHGEADANLTAARRTGAALLTVTGDAFVHDIVQAIDESERAQDSTRLRALVHGQLALIPDRDQYDPGRAESLLRAAGSPMALHAAYLQGEIAYQRLDSAGTRDALTAFEEIERVARPARYRLLTARSAAYSGLIYEAAADFDAAYSARTRALRDADGVGSPGFVARQHAYLARLSARLRGEEEAWTHRYHALRLVPAETAPRQRLWVYLDVAHDIMSVVSPQVVIRLQNEAVRAAMEAADNLEVADSGQTSDADVSRVHGAVAAALLTRAQLHHRLGSIASEAEDLGGAANRIEAIPNEVMRREMRHMLLLVSGELRSETDAESALDDLSAAAAYHRATGYFYQVARASLASARAYLQLGAYERADSAFVAAIAETERRRSTLEDLAERAQFLDRARDVFDEMVAFQIARGDTARALDFFEQTRARALLDRFSRGPTDDPSTTALSSAEIRDRLGPGVSILTFAVIADDLHVWVTDRKGVRLVSTEGDARELAERAERFRDLIGGSAAEAELRSASAALYDGLFRSALRDVPHGNRLVLVPDRWVHSVPFAALIDVETGRLLVEDHEFTVAAGSSLYLASRERLASLAGDGERGLLAIGNPAFDQRSFRLPYLPSAEREAREVAAMHRDRPANEVWIGDKGTPAAFLQRAPEFNIIHFAGHAVVESRAPGRSYLLLAAAPNESSDGALYLERLDRLQLPHTTLVILSACETSAGRTSDTEGPSSLARAFFGAGVPSVVASLWAVQDERAADFFAEFHRRLASGETPAAALRSAQLRHIEESRSALRNVEVWAAFQAYGAG